MYGNEPANRAGAPNAMILHIPVAPNTMLTQANFIPTDGLRRVTSDMWAAVPEREELDREVRQYGSPRSKALVTMFDMGAYTWVAANQASSRAISDALEFVRPERRPHVAWPLIDFYLRTWPDDALAIGCFNQAGGEATEPTCIEYVPADWNILRMPAVDAHGEVPRFDQPVLVNHRLIVGTDEFYLGGHVRYSETIRMDHRLAEVLPRRVVGAELGHIPMPNGDFYVDFNGFRRPAGRDEVDVLRAHGPELTPAAAEIPMAIR